MLAELSLEKLEVLLSADQSIVIWWDLQVSIGGAVFRVAISQKKKKKKKKKLGMVTELFP